jgi:hypothetical protein
MAVILGSATTVEVIFSDNTRVTRGITTINLSYGQNINRLYALGMGTGNCGPDTWGEIQGCQMSLDFSMYAGQSPALDICPPTTCEDGNNRVIVNIAPAATLDTIKSISLLAYIQSYSYQKEKFGYGTEQWSCIAYSHDLLQDQTGPGQWLEMLPAAVVINLAEGTINSEDPNIDVGTSGSKSTAVEELEDLVGARFLDYDLGRKPKISRQLSVTAGPLSKGEYGAVLNGRFKSIGGSTFS